MAKVRAGDLVEVTVASNRPRLIHVRVDREPWELAEQRSVLCDGRRPYSVFTASIRVVEAAQD